MNHKLISFILLLLLLLQLNSLIHMNYNVVLDSDETEDFFLCTFNDISIEGTKVKYKEIYFLKTNDNSSNPLKTVIVINPNSISFFSSHDLLNSKPMISLKIINLFTQLYEFISLLVVVTLLIFWEDYNSVVFKNKKSSVFLIRNFSNMVRYYYFEKN